MTTQTTGIIDRNINGQGVGSGYDSFACRDDQGGFVAVRQVAEDRWTFIAGDGLDNDDLRDMAHRLASGGVESEIDAIREDDGSHDGFCDRLDALRGL